MASRIQKRVGYVLAFAIVATLGVRIYFWLSQPWSAGLPGDRTNIRDVLTIELPQGSRHRILQGIDTDVGEIDIAGTAYTLTYDIGGLAGNYATSGDPSRFTWQKHEEFDGVRMDYALTKQGSLCIAFPEIGMANFFTDLRHDSDAELILKSMRTVRPRDRGPSSLDWEETDLPE